MKTKLIALVIIAFAFTACNNNDDPKPTAVIPTGSWKLTELHYFDKTGKDSATTTLSKSTLSISFDKSKNLASFTGKPEEVAFAGSYKLDGSYKLTPGTITPDNATPVLDKAALVFLKAGYLYEIKTNSVIIYAKNKGFMVYSPISSAK
ncbi:hypothetical protein NF867_12265 [Solitalea sp. MAHUQ-68]|uniref:DUF306 domain-containing protein n=1 Tax=Solitalea agri TaxID=2953739 RepID=A0A9X2F2R9_9SPHI|nr:hypothetical protein [Solitalea agri]MCO4293639.1 hypothetical protein [Solitalea agri]